MILENPSITRSLNHISKVPFTSGVFKGSKDLDLSVGDHCSAYLGGGDNSIAVHDGCSEKKTARIMVEMPPQGGKGRPLEGGI